MSNPEKSKISEFFREDQLAIKDFLAGETDQVEIGGAGIIQKETIPMLAPVNEVSEEEAVQYWTRLRSFFRNGDLLASEYKDLSPFLLAPMYTEKLITADYPVWIPSKKESGTCSSFKGLVLQALEKFAAKAGEAHIIKDNIDILNQIALRECSGKNKMDFSPAWQEIKNGFKEQLQVKGAEERAFLENLELLGQSLPDQGYLIDFSKETSWHFLSNAISTVNDSIRKRYKDKLSVIISKLKEKLNLESLINTGIDPGDEDSGSFSFADKMVNFKEISNMVPKEGSEGLGEDRAKRIAETVSKLEQLKSLMDGSGYIFIEDQLISNSDISWEEIFSPHLVESCNAGTAVISLEKCFSQTITAWEEFIKFKRVAELELKNEYRTNAHDDYFAHFSWEDFSEEEMQACPVFVLIAEDHSLFKHSYHKLISMFSRGIPFKIVAVRSLNQTHMDIKDQKNFPVSVAEIGFMMFAHRNIFVHQCTAVTPIELQRGMQDAVQLFTPAFIYLLEETESDATYSYLKMSALVEGRDFPGFTFRGLSGTPWSSRFDIHNNPQQTLDWPKHSRKIKDAGSLEQDWELDFTFPDLLVLDSQLRDQIMAVPNEFWDEDLITVTDYLKNDSVKNIGKVPFIWMIDTSNVLQKVAVSWNLIVAAGKRLDYWRFLQENSGINNILVNKAIERTKAELNASFETRIAAMEEAQQQAVENARTEEAEQVMEHLTSVLLDLDLTSIPDVSSTSGNSGGKVSQNLASTENKDEKKDALPKIDDQGKSLPGKIESSVKEAEEEEIVLSNDPYIETAMCTSCNECIQRNGVMFKYNSDKLAYLADPKAGTYKDLVEAAEACPVAIIHPGSPLDPSEAGLEELLERAKKFN